MGKAFYFGCYGHSGHYLFDKSMTKNSRYFDEIPWGFKIDTGLLDKTRSQTEGLSTLSQKDGWTALSFWDRSVDKRPGSNSAFIAEGEKTFEEMLEIGSTMFPKVFARLPFTILAPSQPQKGEK